MMSSPHHPASIPTRAEGARPRPLDPPARRQRARNLGVDHLDERELVALVVERDLHPSGCSERDDFDEDDEPIERRVARWFDEGGGLGGLASRGVGALIEELGLAPAGAARLAAAFELAIRLAALARDPSLQPATSAADVEHWARARLAWLPHEELWALLLDSRNRIVAERLVARGGLHAMALTARDVLRPVIREASSAFVLVHNHPGGDPCPSREDLHFTKTVIAGAGTLGVALVDHVVVAREASVSMLEAGLLDTLE